MVEPCRLKKPPIKEALIALQFPESKAGSEVFDKFRSLVPNVTKVDTLWTAGARFGPGPQISTPQEGKFDGLRLHTNAGFVVQARINRFIFSQLLAYTNFEALRDAALESWSLFKDCVQPAGLQRLAVRYINRFDVPSANPIADYLTTAFDAAQLYGMEPTSRLSRVQMVIPDRSLEAQAVQVLQPSLERPGYTSVILDVEAQRTSGVVDDLSSLLSELRELKNKIFFRSITDTTIELLGGAIDDKRA